MNMSYDSSNLTTPDIKWLGVRPSDLDRFNIPQQCRLAMTDDDVKMGKKLVSLSNLSRLVLAISEAKAGCEGHIWLVGTCDVYAVFSVHVGRYGTTNISITSCTPNLSHICNASRYL